LNNSHLLANILLTPQTEFTSAQIRKAKELYKELFEIPSDGTDARTIGAEWIESTKTLSNELSGYAAQKFQYPFLVALEPLSAKIAAMVGKPAAWYITEPATQEDVLLAAKDEVLDKVRSFMGGAQKVIYDDAREFLRDQEANISYVNAAAGEALANVLADPACYNGSAIQALKSDLYALKDRVELAVLDERKAVIAAVDDCTAKVAQTPEFQGLAPDEQSRIKRSINNHKAGLEAVKMIHVMRDRANGARLELLPRILAEVERLSRPVAPPLPGPGMSEPPAAPPLTPTYVHASEIKVAFAKDYLIEEADVEQYVQEMKKALLELIRAGKKVIL
jgi:hypothetical protein